MLGSFTRAAVVALLAGAPAASASVLVGVASFAPFTTQSLYSINTQTGAATLIGDTGVAQFVGIAWNGSRLYGYTTGADLYTIDISSGAATLVADGFGIVPEGDLAFDASGALWSVNLGVLGRIDTTTGAFDPIGSIGSAATDVSALAFVPEFQGFGPSLIGYAHNGQLDDAVVRFDVATGEASVLFTTGPGAGADFAGADFDALSDMTFLVLDNQLWTLDQSGAMALVGATGVGGFSGIAVIPTPFSGVALALGAFVACRRSR